MNKLSLFFRILPGVILFGLAIYLLILVIKNPVNPDLPLLKPSMRKVSDFLREIKKRPVLYPSQIKRITFYLKSLNSQIVEGFGSIVSFSNRDSWTTYWSRRNSITWTERNHRPGEKVVWNTATCEQKKTTTFIFSGGLGPSAGESEILVGEKPILIFNTGTHSHRKTQKNQRYEIRFFPLTNTAVTNLSSGIFCLTVPESDVLPGKALKITVRVKWGKDQLSYFTLHNFSDTLKILSEDQKQLTK